MFAYKHARIHSHWVLSLYVLLFLLFYFFFCCVFSYSYFSLPLFLSVSVFCLFYFLFSVINLMSCVARLLLFQLTFFLLLSIFFVVVVFFFFVRLAVYSLACWDTWIFCPERYLSFVYVLLSHRNFLSHSLSLFIFLYTFSIAFIEFVICP